MALDINALKSKLNSFKRTGGGDRDTAIWKPKEGKTVIRIVPWKDNPENPFIELYFHYLGNKTHLSPLSYGNRDPIAEAIRTGMDRKTPGTYDGVAVAQIDYEGEAHLPEDDAGNDQIYLIQMEFTVNYHR